MGGQKAGGLSGAAARTRNLRKKKCKKNIKDNEG